MVVPDTQIMAIIRPILLATFAGFRYPNMAIIQFTILATFHSVLTGCVIIFEMSVTPLLFIKSSIYTCRTDMCQMIKHLRQKNSGPIDILRSYMKRIFKLLKL